MTLLRADCYQLSVRSECYLYLTLVNLTTGIKNILAVGKGIIKNLVLANNLLKNGKSEFSIKVRVKNAALIQKLGGSVSACWVGGGGVVE